MKTLLQLLFFLLTITFSSFAQTPIGFQDNLVQDGFDQANGVTFDASGRMFVWEKGGKVLVKSGSANSDTLLNISDEVNVATDSGLKGFALDPNFLTNSYIYLMYDVDRYFLLNKRTLAVITQDLIIYGDTLNSDWNSASSTISSLYLFNTTQPFINTTSIKVTNPTSDEVLDLRHNTSYVDTTGYIDGLSFWVYNQGNISYPLQIQTFADNSGGGGSGSINVTADANKWTHFQFGWSLFGSPSKVGRIVIKLNQTQTQSLYIDEIKLLHCAEMYSINSGNWNAPTTWSCGRVPIVTDDIMINAGHTVSIPNGVNATLKFLYLLGTLNPLSGSTFNIYKF